MVIEDENLIPKKNTSLSMKPNEWALAFPLDRLAATITDLILFIIPVSSIFIAPLKKNLMESLILQEEIDVYLYIGLFALIFLSVLVMYQTCMVALWGGTLGKLFWGLRVESIWHRKKPSWISSFLRALFWLFDSFLIFIPHLSVFSNEKRRPFHDRISDTVVVTKKSQGVPAPNIVEVSFVHGVLASIAVISTIFIILNSINFYFHLKSNSQLIEAIEDEESICQFVTQTSLEWNENRKKPFSRLKVAMALFAAGEISTSCLQPEVDFIFKQSTNKEDLSLAYLAQAFIYEDESDLSDRYLKEICQLNRQSDICKMSQIVEMGANEKWLDVDHKYQDLYNTKEDYIKIWAIRHFIKKQNYAAAETYFNRLDFKPSLGSFFSESRTQIFWGLDPPEKALAAAAVALDALDTSSRVSLSNWLCAEELRNSCQATNHLSCTVFQKATEGTKEYLTEPKFIITYIRQNNCLNKKTGWENKIQLKSADPLIEALHLHQKKQPLLARKKLELLIKNTQLPYDFREEARSYLTQWSIKKTDLDMIFKDWKNHPQRMNWIREGNELISQLNKLNEYDRIWEIGQLILQAHAPEAKLFPQNILEKLIIAGYKIGEKEPAFRLLKMADSQKFNKINEFKWQRQPAHQNDFRTISEALTQEFLFLDQNHSQGKGP